MRNKEAVNEFIQTYNEFAEKLRGLAKECGFDEVEAAVVLAGCSQVDSGHVGVKTTWGKASNDPCEPGLHFVEMFSQAMHEYDCREQCATYKMQSYTKDVQSAEFQIVVNWTLDKSRVIEVHNTYGKSFADKILTPVIYGAVKDVVGHWEAAELVNGRDKATREMFDLMRERTKGQPVTIDNVTIANVDYADTFERAIEEKVCAQQAALRAKNKTAEVEELAKQKLISARSEAEAMQIKGDALKANQGLVELEAIAKRDGKMPATLVVGEGAKTFLPVK